MNNKFINYLVRKIKRLIQCKSKRLPNNTYLTGGKMKDFQTGSDVKKNNEHI